MQVIKGSLWGGVFAAWVVGLLGFFLLLIAPHFHSLGFGDDSAIAFLVRLLSSATGLSLPPNPTLIGAMILLAGIALGAVLSAFLSVLNPRLRTEVNSALQWALESGKFAFPIAIVVMFALAAIAPRNTASDAIIVTFVLLLFLLFGCFRLENLEAERARWWRPGFPGVRPLLFAASLILAWAAVRFGCVVLVSYASVQSAIAVIALWSFEALLALSAITVFVFRLGPLSLVRFVQTSRLGELLRAWVDLNLRLLVILAGYALPLAPAFALSMYFIPIIEADAVRAGIDLPSSLGVIERFARNVQNGYWPAVALPLVVFTWLASGRLLILLRREGVLIVEDPDDTREPVVIIDGQKVSCRVPGNKVQEMLWEDLKAVIIRTNDEGPWFEDVYLILCSDSKDYFCAIPQCSEGADELVARLLQLPGFDYEAFNSAMGCASNRSFLCWEKKGWMGENWPGIVVARNYKKR